MRLSESLKRNRTSGALGLDLPTGPAEDMAIPDLLNLQPKSAGNRDAVNSLLELAFLGREDAKGLERELGVFDSEGDGWNLELFAEDLFVKELIRGCYTIQIEGLRFPVNHAFLYGVLSDPPSTLEAVQFRQDILRELESNETLLRNSEKLYQELSQLLSMFKQPDHSAKLDINAFRLDLLKLAKWIIDWMVSGFADAKSGLNRLHQAGLEIQASNEYGILADLLDYQSRQSTLRVRVQMGADGELKTLTIEDFKENTKNRFYRGPLRRFFDRLKLFVLYGYRLSQREMASRLLREVYLKISPSITPLVQLISQLELYLASLSLKRRVADDGLEMSLANFDDTQPLDLEQVFNPLLLDLDKPPVPCSIRSQGNRAITIVTGPNSGGKTRLLQTVGLTQLLGQSGLYVPAASANLPMIRGMFVSLVESETASQAEGRLGRELLRIRHLFEAMGSPSMVILDELCSGTNPAEGTDIFSMVVRLLDRLQTVSFISTHFLDFARSLRDEQPVPSLEYLQVETQDDLTSTYQFQPGVAETSLAAATADRLGVSFDELSTLIDQRRQSRQASDEPTEEAATKDPAPAVAGANVS
ncbi:MAG: DNA mismatch repair protein [Acidobacteriota bacterium]